MQLEDHTNQSQRTKEKSQVYSGSRKTGNKPKTTLFCRRIPTYYIQMSLIASVFAQLRKKKQNKTIHHLFFLLTLGAQLGGVERIHVNMRHIFFIESCTYEMLFSQNIYLNINRTSYNSQLEMHKDTCQHKKPKLNADKHLVYKKPNFKPVAFLISEIFWPLSTSKWSSSFFFSFWLGEGGHGGGERRESKDY